MSKILFINFNIHHLYLDDDIPTGGATVQTSNWIRGFQANNYRVGVLGYKGIDSTPFTDKNIDFIESFYLNKGIRILRNIYYRLPKIFFTIRIYDPDIIFMDVPGWSTVIYAIISRILNKTFILRISNDMVVDNRFKQKLGIIRYYLFYISLKFSSVILCQNTYQAKNIKKKFPQQKLLKIYNPYNIDGQKVYPGEGKYVAWIGIFQYQKNLGALLNITKQLMDVEFRIAGKPQEMLDEGTNKALSELRTMNNVIFVGFLLKNEILEFLASSYCLLNTSHYEGFSNTFLEAVSVGTPIVTRREIDPDHIIERNDLGLVAEYYNSIPEKIMKLIKSGKSQYYIRGSRYLKKYHNPKALANKVILNLEKA
ncbi:MAG: glycosyltransferase family 4 protein [Bacteroidetes bacterium]|nr:glycosyltransferase family 4 protein [Bacteroidota bacterium]